MIEKTSNLINSVSLEGGKGLHVVTPIRPECEWEKVKKFAYFLPNP